MRGAESLMLLARALRRYERVTSLQLWVVTNSIHDISGDEHLRPINAAIVGLCETLTHQQPNLICRCVDIVAPSARYEQLIDHLAAECLSATPDALVAYRNGRRWIPTIELIDDTHADGLRAGGVYLINGGLTDAGYPIAEQLARLTRPKLILTTATALPEHGAGGDVRFDLAREQEHITQLAVTINAELAPPPLPPELEQLSDALCVSYICAYLRDNGIDISAGARYPIDMLKQRLSVASSYDKLLQFMLTALVEDGVASLSAETITFCEAVTSVTDPAELRERIRAHYPASDEGFQALDHCVARYTDVLAGNITAVSVLFPGGDSTMMRSLEENQLRFSNLRACRALLAETVAHLSGQCPNRPLRILEVGAGDGGVTWEIAPRLIDRTVEYTFTDIGRTFVLSAEKHAGREGFDGMRFDVLDISRDPITQGYKPYHFDVIIAAEVIHATPDVKASLTNLSRLLAPGGALFVLEATRAQRWASMIWGLLDGWWSFADTQLRRHSPLLSADAWRSAAAELGFAAGPVYPNAGDQNATAAYTLIIAQQSVTPTTPDYRSWEEEQQRLTAQTAYETQQRIRKLEELGAETLIVHADPADAQTLRAAVAQGRDLFGALHGVFHIVNAADNNGSTSAHDINRAALIASWNRACRELSALQEAFQDTQLELAVAMITTPALRRAPESVSTPGVRRILEAFSAAATQQHGSRWSSVVLDALPDDPKATWLQRIANGDCQAHLIVTSERLNPRRWNEFNAFEQALPQAKSAIPAAHPRPNLPNPYIAPRDDTERTVAQLWTDILGIADIGIYDSFFDFGGDSLQATQLTSRLRETFDVDLSVRTLFETPTVAGIAETITRAQSEASAQDALEILAMLEQLSAEEIAAELQKRKQPANGADDDERALSANTLEIH